MCYDLSKWSKNHVFDDSGLMKNHEKNDNFCKNFIGKNNINLKKMKKYLKKPIKMIKNHDFWWFWFWSKNNEKNDKFRVLPIK